MTTRTLSRWVDRLPKGQVKIECPEMRILGRDHELPVFTGPGHIEIGSDTRIQFVMHGTARDGAEAFRKIIKAQKSPYSVLDQFRMEAVSYDGASWSGGWTTLHLGGEAKGLWRLSGPIASLHTHVAGKGVANTSSVELVYDLALRLPIPMNMEKTVRRDGQEILFVRSKGRKTIRVLDIDIEFSCSPEHDHVWALANTSSDFPHPHLENWLSEPLNLLLGQIISPRLIARNFGDGSAHIALRPRTALPLKTVASSILAEDPLRAGEKFWQLFSDILAMIAKARDSAGHRNFEAHPLTRYYWEIIQAVSSSNWVLCLTLASAIEGITKMMLSTAEKKSDWSAPEIESLRSTVKDWKGDQKLRDVVLNYLGGFKNKSVPKMLAPLVDEGIVTNEQIDAWVKLRNVIMHGELVLPWADKTHDTQIANLLDLVHRVSTEYIKREVAKTKRTL